MTLSQCANYFGLCRKLLKKKNIATRPVCQLLKCRVRQGNRKPGCCIHNPYMAESRAAFVSNQVFVLVVVISNVRGEQQVYRGL